MNMNKALQNLYHAVSGSTTKKVNISKLLVDIHQAITGKESPNKNNWSKIINSMAENWPAGGGGSWTVLTEESVTTVAGEYGDELGNETELTYAELITADSIIVTFDGNEYTCPVVSMGEGQYGYGGVDSSWNYNFSEYPFAIVSENSINYFATQTAGTYSIKIEAPAESGSSDFSTAQVTFVNNTGFSSAAYVPNCLEENALGQGSPAMVMYLVSTPDATPVVANVPLYKGSCYGFWDTNDEQIEISVNGDALLTGGGTILITGDCTITIS